MEYAALTEPVAPIRIATNQRIYFSPLPVLVLECAVMTMSANMYAAAPETKSHWTVAMRAFARGSNAMKNSYRASRRRAESASPSCLTRQGTEFVLSRIIRVISNALMEVFFRFFSALSMASFVPWARPLPSRPLRHHTLITKTCVY